MKKVITYGTFDLFHIGHLNLLSRARALGDWLIVAVSTDEFNESKNKKAMVRFEDRIEIVKNIRVVDEVIPETCWEQKIVDIKERSIDIFVIGEDWEGKFDFLKEYCDVVYLPRTENISSTQIRNALRTFDAEHISEMKKAIDVFSSILKNFE